MASHILKASSIYMQMISAFMPDLSQRQTKQAGSLTTAPVSRKHTGYRPGLSRGPVKQSQEKSGFPLENMKNMIIERWMQAHNLLQKSEFHAKSSK